MFLRDRIDADERGPLTRDTIYNGGPGGERFHERERAQVLLAVHLDQATASGDQPPNRPPERLGEKAGRVADSDMANGGQGPERIRVDRFVALRLEIYNPDERGMAELESPLGDPIPARAEQRQFADVKVGLGPGVHRSVALSEPRTEGDRDGPRRLVT
jgi:hypothetical protein